MTSTMTEPFQCEAMTCRQLIQYHEGVNRVVNMADGPGGKRGDDHVCPERVGSKFHHYKPVNPKEQFLICYCNYCGFPHYMHMACPMCYDDHANPIAEVHYVKSVRKAQIPYHVNRQTRQLEIMDIDKEEYVPMGDIHNAKTWSAFADIQRKLIKDLNLKSL